MASRTVTVRLRADISSYTRGMRQAASQTSTLAKAGAGVGTVLVGAFAVAAASAAKFDKEMSNVRAVTVASGKEFEKLRTAALDASKTTIYTATQAAEAEAELARAGISTADIIGGALQGSLALAASGQVDLADAAIISAQAMNTFGLAGKDVTHIADVLAAGANKSASDVNGLAIALRQGGLLAHQTGLSLEETVGTLSAFADHALIGSDAGTSLKTMLQRLVPQSAEAQRAMDKIGFSAYDVNGEFVGLEEMARRIKTSFSKLTPEARNAAMNVIFGSDAVRSATIMYELGAEGVTEYTKAVDDQGAASRMAATQVDNLAGDLEMLRAAFEVALIEGGSAANGALRTMTQWVTRLVNAYNDLPPELQHAVTLLSGVGGAAGLAVAGFLLLLPRIAATRTALSELGVTAARTRTTLKVLGQVGMVVAAMEAISYATQAARDQFKDAPPSVSKLANSFVDLAQGGKVGGEALDTLGKDLGDFGEAVKRVAHPDWEARSTDIVNSLTMNLTKGMMEAQIPLDEAHDKIKAVDQALAELASSGDAALAAKSFDQLAAAAERDGTSKEKLLTLLPQYTDALASIDTQAKTSAGSQEDLASKLGMTADEMADQRSEAEKLTDALKTLNGLAIDTATREISFRQSLADLTKAVKANGKSLDVSTEKGRKVKSAYLDAAKAAQEHAEAVAEQTGSQAKGQKVLEKDISLLKQQMKAAGFSKDAIDKLISSYLQVPGQVTTKVDTKTEKALTDLDGVQKKLAGTKSKTVTVDALTKEGQKQLEDLGFKIKRTKGKKVEITVPTGGQKAGVDALRLAIEALRDKQVEITTHYKITGNPGGRVAHSTAGGGHQFEADGGILKFFARGGTEPGDRPNQHLAQITAAGTYRVWGERETDGEGYVPFRRSARPRSRRITEEIVRRLGGNPSGIQWNARGSVTRFASGGIPGWTYAPTGQPVLGGPTDAKSRYDKAVEALKKAWADLAAAQKKAAAGSKAVKEAQKREAQIRTDNARKVAAAEKHLADVRRGKHSAKQLAAAEKQLADARYSAAKSNNAAAARTKKARDAASAKSKDVAAARKRLYEADAALGLKKGAKAPAAFNLEGYELQLNKSVAATEKWRKNLDKIGRRGGAELKAMLEAMGEEGYALVNALAGASDKQFRSIVKKLEKTGELAKATLADFTKQLGASTKESQQFAADLQKLAAQGFGDLAQALAAQGDSAAMALAHEAVSNSKAAREANAQVGKAQSTLTGEDLANALTLLTVLRGGAGRGFADLIAAGLDVATIRSLVPKMTAQISSLPPANKDTFVRQWVEQGGKAMAAGGILTRPTMVLGAEAGVPESWIPWNSSARSRGLLAKTAAAMGYQLTPAGRYGSAPSTAAVAREVTKHIEVHLHGAQQSSAEQAHDIARRISFVG
ncbi:phage tail tape measure protein [Streptomyces sp. NPDC042207]|uniref:phage tail tape measure protein n=1 Tax=Streptomyces sp. NPDC042207 TaxID=3154331 RepID=UPI0033C5E48C